jgi:integrase
LKKARESHAVDGKDADAVRARRATANRTLTVLKAALNHAFHDGRIVTDEAWRKVKPFREADAPVVHFLSEDECRRIVNACDGAFRSLVRAALLSGCRYGELTRMRASDFNAESGTITVRESKSDRDIEIEPDRKLERARLFAAAGELLVRDPLDEGEEPDLAAKSVGPNQNN